MSTVAKFQRDFLLASSPNRAAILQKVQAQNQHNSQILNLLANVNINYTPNKNPALESQERRKADNIFFICSMLNAFQDFRYV